MEELAFSQFESRIGNAIVAPNDWESDDQGAMWFITSPDRLTALTIATYTVEGSGSLDDLEKTVIQHAMPDVEGGWEKTDRIPIRFRQGEARVFDLSPRSESESRYRIFLLQAGQFYHMIAISASDIMLTLNGGFYDELAQSFVGKE